MKILADPDDACLNTLPFPEFSRSLGTVKERLKSSLSTLVSAFVAAVHYPASHFAFSDMLPVVAVPRGAMRLAEHLCVPAPCASCPAVSEPRRRGHGCSSC